jgi:antitoxin (DNA-binding transcriptional repressor) of toxin-antitoxin stability system
MGTVKIADLKNNLSRHLAHVRRGGEITVLDRDTPVARIVPFVAGGQVRGRRGTAAAPGDDRMAELVRQGIVAAGNPPAAAAWFKARTPVRIPAGSRGGVDVLLEMRRESTR